MKTVALFLAILSLALGIANASQLVDEAWVAPENGTNQVTVMVNLTVMEEMGLSLNDMTLNALNESSWMMSSLSGTDRYLGMSERGFGIFKVPTLNNPTEIWLGNSSNQFLYPIF